MPRLECRVNRDDPVFAIIVHLEPAVFYRFVQMIENKLHDKQIGKFHNSCETHRNIESSRKKFPEFN